MKKLMLLMMAAIIALLLTGCYIPPEVFRDDRAVVTDAVKGLLVSVCSGDDAAAQACFAPALRGEKLAEQMRALADFLPEGEPVLIREHPCGAARSTHDGERVWTLKAPSVYSFDGQIICVTALLCTYDTAEPDNVGLHSVYVIRGEDFPEYERVSYWGDGAWTPGVNLMSCEEETVIMDETYEEYAMTTDE